MAVGGVSRMVEDYLKIIWKAEEWPGGSVSTNEIAAILGVTPSSVSANLKKLARDGFIDYAPYGSITLSPEGRGIAVRMVRRHRVLESFLVECLGFGWDEVHPEADALEHAVSDRVLDRMDQVLGYPDRDPHGDPIPRADGSVERNPAARLREIAPGEEGRVVRISDHEPEILRYLEERQIMLGTAVRLHARNPAAGSVSVTRRNMPGQPPEVVEIAIGAADAVWVSIAPRALP
ncbi:HTH-type transcriptional regulator MntR [Propionicimonas sp. T2.31MG-18]|uniref:metal-dependent transcriptional regulator n=1 Tax=Propionicimonas sp. T2.31MG-18 TaxID=3157620 RepID=UPI0035E972B2